MKELSIEENAKAYTELINRLEDVKEAIKEHNYGIAMDMLCKPYPAFQSFPLPYAPNYIQIPYRLVLFRMAQYFLLR